MLKAMIRLIFGAIALAGAIGGAAALNPGSKAREDVAFLERLASTVERAQVIPPETHEFVAKITARHDARLADARLDLRRRGALVRIRAVMGPAD